MKAAGPRARLGQDAPDHPLGRDQIGKLVTEKAVGKHSTSIFGKLGLVPSEDDNRRVLAVLT